MRKYKFPREDIPLKAWKQYQEVKDNLYFSWTKKTIKKYPELYGFDRTGHWQALWILDQPNLRKANDIHVVKFENGKKLEVTI